MTGVAATLVAWQLALWALGALLAAGVVVLIWRELLHGAEARREGAARVARARSRARAIEMIERRRARMLLRDQFQRQAAYRPPRSGM